MEIEITKEYYDDEKTKILEITYHKKGDDDFWHREDGPAHQCFRTSGQLECESYWINSNLHRENGPAFIIYNEDGSIDIQQFWLHGCKLSEKEWKMKMRLKGTLLEGKY